MNSEKSNAQNPLLQLPDATDRTILEHLNIKVKPGLRRLYYYREVKKLIRTRLHPSENRKMFGSTMWFDETTIALAEDLLLASGAKPSWENLLLVVAEVYGPVEDMLPKADAPKPKPSVPLAVNPALQTFLEKRAIIFTAFQRYSNGLFHDAQDRILIEHMLMLSSHYLKKHGKQEFYHSLDAIASETGVRLHSIRRFLDKVQKLGLIEVQRKGIPARFWYHLNEARLLALFENIHRTRSIN
jgi:hypothetical protein